ncbi:MAG: NAD(P)H-hydrate dehydratase [Betaproteobacteria bacterium]|nr:NAD(P)H-hydrate dehydratase [Betaproteobacteria bacterium]
MTDPSSLIYRTDDIRRIEAAAFAQKPPQPLMARAGLAAAELARALLHDRRRVLVFAGPGNNGGDAFVAATHLEQWGREVTVVFTGEPSKLPADARAAYDRWRDVDGSTLAHWPEDLAGDLLVDGLFGIGLERDLTGPYAELVTRMNASGTPILALDIPSGLHADSGRVLGTAVRARHTVTFLALKPGLLTLDGPDHAGTVHVAPIGIDAATVLPPAGFVVDDRFVRAALPPRPHNSHKGHYGSVAIVGGAPGMTGAALLAGRAALHLGAGRVYVGMLAPEGGQVDGRQPELMIRSGHDAANLEGATTLVVGPGLGQSHHAAAMLDLAVERDVPLVLDADGLNLVATEPTRAARVRVRSAPTILTPHPAEAARLLNTTVASIQADRIAAALRMAGATNAWVVLKGAGSVCAGPDGTWYVNTSGNPGMAAAGMGDVLSGIVGALLGQGASPRDALLAGVRIHGLAGDRVVRQVGGPLGITASEVSLAARAEAVRIAVSQHTSCPDDHPGVPSRHD